MSYWFRQALRKADPYHDAQGRFTTADGAQSGGQGANLTAEDHNIQAHLAAKLKDFPAAVQEYSALKDSQGGKILNTDVARELSADYLKDRTKSAAVHEPASKFIKQLYAEKLAEEPTGNQLPLVLFTAGGTGAGKTTAIKSTPELQALSDEAQIIYDTNMNTYDSAKAKIEQALAAGKDVHIATVQRDPVDSLVGGALPRAMRQEKEFGSGRTVPLAEHLKTHIGVTETIPKLAAHFADNPRVHFSYIDNSRGAGQAVEIASNQLKSYDKSVVSPALNDALEAEFKAGRISESVYKGFKHG